MEVLTDSYTDWSGKQTYLHIVTEHDAVDDAEAMYRRAMAFAATRELTEFRAELADLRDPAAAAGGNGAVQREKRSVRLSGYQPAAC